MWCILYLTVMLHLIINQIVQISPFIIYINNYVSKINLKNKVHLKNKNKKTNYTYSIYEKDC